jgi:hypothetical protein
MQAETVAPITPRVWRRDVIPAEELVFSAIIVSSFGIVIEVPVRVSTWTFMRAIPRNHYDTNNLSLVGLAAD